MEKFSVLQSVYKNDNAVYLNDCFVSLYNSTIKPVEIILVKDGPISDELNSVIDQWKSKLPLNIVGYNDNKGLACALNYGIKFIKTEYVARMDSDDICFPNRFEKQLDFFSKNDHAEICGTGICEFYGNLDETKNRKCRLYPEISETNSRSLFKGTPVAHPTVMMKTQLLKKYMYSENTKMNEDIELWFRIITDGIKIYNLQEPLLYFRITDGTFKRRSLKKAFNEYRIYVTNLYKLFGISYLYIYPIARLLTRFLPSKIIKNLYFSKARERIFKNKG